MLCYCPRVVVCVGIVVTYVSPVPSLPSSSPCPWLFHPQWIRPACPCRGCCRRLAIGPSGEPSDDDDNDDPVGGACLPLGRASQTSTAPTCLHHPRHRCHPLEMPLSKLVWRDLQEIARMLSCFCVSIVAVDVVLHRNAVAVVALPILPPNEP